MIQKLSLTFIFGGAVFVMAAGILRAALILHVRHASISRMCVC